MKTIRIILILTLTALVYLTPGCKPKEKETEPEKVLSLNFEKLAPTNDGAVFEIKINGSDIDSSNDIIITKDGGYMIAGYTFSLGNGKGDACLVKCSAAGGLEWCKTYGATENDQVFSVVQTLDGGYAAAGKTESYGAGKRDMYIIKVDTTGNLEWYKSYGGAEVDDANCIIQTKDTGYFVAGMTYSRGAGNGDVALLKLNQTGDLEWEKTFGGKGKDYAAHVEETADGGYIVAGSGGDKTDMYILKLDSLGNVLWEKMIGGENFDLANCIIISSHGGYVAAGLTQPEAGGFVEIYVVKISDTGKVEWERQVGGKDHSGAQSVKETADGGYIVSGSTKNTDIGIDNAFLLKLTSRGEVEWMETFGSHDIAYGNCVVEKSPNLYTVTGYILSTQEPAKGDYGMYFFSYMKD